MKTRQTIPISQKKKKKNIPSAVAAGDMDGRISSVKAAIHDSVFTAMGMDSNMDSTATVPDERQTRQGSPTTGYPKQ